MGIQADAPVTASWNVREDGTLDVPLGLVHTLSELRIFGMDRMPYSGVEFMIQLLARELPTGATLEFDVYDALPVLEGYRVNRYITQEMSDSIFANNKRSIWDEGSIARILLIHGFGRVWTGRVEGIPEHNILVKAIKV